MMKHIETANDQLASSHVTSVIYGINVENRDILFARAIDVGGMRKQQLTKTACEFHHSIYLFNVQLKGRIRAENSNLKVSLY